MKQALALFWESIKAFYDDLFMLLLANLLWVLGTILVVTAPAASAGLHFLTNEMAHDRRVSLSFFWTGFQQYFWPSLGLGAINLLLIAGLFVNYQFYGQVATDWARWIQGAFVALAIFWALIQIYLFPMLMEQLSRNILLPFRNAAYMVLATPVVTITAAVLILLVLGLSTVLVIPLLIGGVALVTLFSNKLAFAKLQDFKRMQASWEAKDAQKQKEGNDAPPPTEAEVNAPSS